MTGQITHGNVNEKYAYFCYGEEWKRFYGNENIVYEKLIDERDGQIYRTVKIGEQTWIAENLNYADSAKYPSDLIVEDLGRLYYGSYPVYYRTEYREVDFADVCPEGWHVPVDSEWIESDGFFIETSAKCEVCSIRCIKDEDE